MRRTGQVTVMTETIVVFSPVPLMAIATEPVTDTTPSEKVEQSADLVTDRPADQDVDRVWDTRIE